MPITPDTADWTWVLERPCPDCGFDASTADPRDVGRLLRLNAADWQELLAHPQVRQRPREDRWSGLEYGCHVRDTCLLFDRRLVLMLTEDEPLFANWDQDASAVEQRYDQADPADVAARLAAAAATLADRFDAVSGDQWLRPGRRGDGAVFTVDSFARYFIHDPVHHVHDVRAGYALLAAR